MKKIYSLILISVFAGCMAVPEVEKNKTDVSLLPKFEVEDLVFNNENWWDVYKDENLERLMTIAIDANKELKIADLNIQKAEIGIDKANANLFPTLSGNSKYTTTNPSDTGAISPNNAHYPSVNLREINIAGQYNLDIWGKYKNLVKKAKYQKEALIINSKAIETNVTTRVALLYGSWITLDRQRKYLIEQRNILNELIKIQDKSFSLGKSTGTDILALENNANQLEIALENNKLSMDIVESNFNLLTGMVAQEEIHTILQNVLNSKAKIFRILPLPTKVESKVVICRPDVLYYLNTIMAQEQQMKFLQKGFYPDITIFGQVGFASIYQDELLKRKSMLSFAGVGMTFPIFQGGAIRAGYKIAGVDLNIFIEDYNSALINAFTQINNELLATKTRTKTVKRNGQILVNTAKYYQNEKNKYNLGYISKQELLFEELKYSREKINYETENYNLYSNQIKLINALGGIYTKKDIAEVVEIGAK